MTDDEKGYNGYTNYETWATALWIDNQRETQDYAMRLTAQNDDLNDLAEAIKDWVTEEILPDLGASLAADLLNAARREIDWYDLANTYREVAAEIA